MARTFTPSPALCSAVNAVWQSIGYDVMACAQECGERLSNVSCVESCCDADRLHPASNLGGTKEAHDEYVAAIAAHGWNHVVRALARTVRLV